MICWVWERYRTTHLKETKMCFTNSYNYFTTGIIFRNPWIFMMPESSQTKAFSLHLVISLVTGGIWTTPLQISPSGEGVSCVSFFCSDIFLGPKKLGWLVEDNSLAHILSVITTLFCFSVILCTKTKRSNQD